MHYTTIKHFMSPEQNIRSTGIALLIACFFLSTCKKDTEPNFVYPTEGLVSYFNFDGNLRDSEGNTPEGVNNGNVPYIKGIRGSAVSFNGINQSIVFNRKKFSNGNQLSVSIWFKCDSENSLKFFAICGEFAVFTNNNQAGMAISVPSTNSAQGNYTPSRWTHLAATFDGTEIKVFIDGKISGTKIHPGTIADLNFSLWLGEFSGEFWKGAVDEFLIYNRVLNLDEINKLYGW